MKPVLVAYGTNAGSTEAVATAVGEELGKGGARSRSDGFVMFVNPASTERS